MEVLSGPTLSIEVSSSMPAAKHHKVVSPVTPTDSPARYCLFVAEEEVAVSADSPISSSGGSCAGLGIGLVKALDESSDSSSSIGAPGDSDDEEDDDENGSVVTSSATSVLGSLDSLEEALPVKRGLSNHYTGKSKSFGNIADMSLVSRVKDLAKPENPFNKRRRTLMANKWSRKSFYSSSNPKSMPLLTLLEAGEDDYGDVEDKDGRSPSSLSLSSSSGTQEQRLPHETPRTVLNLYQRRFGSSFKSSQSCFSLTDLQEEEEEEGQYHQ